MSEDSQLLEDALKRFKVSEESENDNRKEALEADKFVIGDGQWANNIRTSREQEGRPCLTTNKTAPAVRQVTNDARQNRPQTKINPSGDGSVDTARVLEGLVRHIQVSSHSDIAIDRAFYQQVVGGWGYFRLLTEYVGDDTFDQEIKIKQVRNRFNVYFDPYCIEPDYSDARWCFVCEDMDREEFKKKYPKGKAGAMDFTSLGDNAVGWGTKDTVRVAEYWCVKETESKLYEFEDGTITDTLIPGMAPKRSRTVMTRKVVMYKITAVDKLSEAAWAGRFIPVIPVIGDDWDIEGKRVMRGMVHDMQDPQRMFNYWTTAQTEAVALAPKAPFVMAEGQDEGYERYWDTANVKNYSRLVYKPVTIAGQPAPPPARNNAEPPIQAMAMLTGQASENLKAVSGIYDTSLGAPSNETSGRAIMARQREGDTSNYHYVDNLSRSMRFLGVQLLDLIPKIYDAPRIIRIVHDDMTHETVRVNEEFDAGNGVSKIYDLTTGKYDVVVNTGPSYTTKRQENAESMIAISQAYPALWQVAGDLLVNNLDWPGASALAERLKKLLPPQLQEGRDNPIPPQAAAEMQQMSAMIEQLTAALNAEKDKSDAKKIETDSKERIAYEKNQTGIIIATIQEESQKNMAIFKGELEHLRARGDGGLDKTKNLGT